jgi:hypothetical protein
MLFWTSGNTKWMLNAELWLRDSLLWHDPEPISIISHSRFKCLYLYIVFLSCNH